MSSEKGLEATRAVRESISREFGNDARALVEHYIGYQKRFADRLRDVTAPQQQRGPVDADERSATAG